MKPKNLFCFCIRSVAKILVWDEDINIHGKVQQMQGEDGLEL